MEFNDDVSLDTSQVQDMRGAGGGGIGGRVALGGGGLGIVGVLIYFVLSQLGGVGGGLPGATSAVDQGQTVTDGKLSEKCRTGRDANKDHDCALVATINSIQGYWTDEFARSGSTYKTAPTRFFTGGIDTGCGQASADVGPFYCPADKDVYIDLSFFKELQTRFGAKGGTFVEAYVLAHEYGHHVQDLLGTSNRVGQETGPKSGSVRLELQADCYAGVWAKHATEADSSGRVFFRNITEQDVANGVDAAQRIGDDFIQSKLGGRNPDPSSFTHGTSAQREKWLRTGLTTGDPTRCDTFETDNLG